jgi:hypothetical protein
VTRIKDGAQGDNFKDKSQAGDGQEKEGGAGVEDLCKGINVEEGGKKNAPFLFLPRRRT